jgi:hypothetical protein
MILCRYSLLIAGWLTLCLLAFETAKADQVDVPNVFSDGEPARADEVNANFNALEDESNSQDDRITALEGESDGQDTRISTLEQSRFVSTWRSIGRAGQRTIDHDLGVVPTHVAVQVASSFDNPTIVHMGGNLHQYLDGEGARGVIVTDITAASVKVRAGNSPVCPVYDTFVLNGSSSRICISNGYVRVIVYR